MDRQAVCPYCDAPWPAESDLTADTPVCCAECGRELPRLTRQTQAIDPPTLDSATGSATTGADPLAELRRRLEEAASVASASETGLEPPVETRPGQPPVTEAQPAEAAAAFSSATPTAASLAETDSPPDADAPPEEIGALFDKLRSLAPMAGDEAADDHDSVVDEPPASTAPALGTLVPGGDPSQDFAEPGPVEPGPVEPGPVEPRLAETVPAGTEPAHSATPAVLEDDIDFNATNRDESAGTTVIGRHSAEGPAPDELAADTLVADVRRQPAASPRGGWSRLRTTAAVGVGTLLGLAGGYAGLITLGGPSYDSLGVLALLNGDATAEAPADSATLPDSPSDALTPPPFAPETEPPAEQPAPAEEVPPAPLTAEPSSPIEQATYEATDPAMAELDEPASDQLAAGPAADEDAIPADLMAAAAAPFAFDAPAGPMLPTGPTYVPAELAQSLAGADEAATTMASNRLADGAGLAIGRSYAKLCDVAERFTRLETREAGERDRAAELFAALFKHAHVASDSRQIARRWLAWGERPHGGVFFAAQPTGGQPAGSVTEYRFPLGGGAEVAVLSTDPLPAHGLGAEVVVIGSVVDSPSENVPGYTGAATQAVWLGHSITLDDLATAPRTSALPGPPAGK